MSSTQSDAPPGLPGSRPVEMLPGVRHYETAGFANTWAVYDALSDEDGWTEQFVSDECGRWKRAVLNGRSILVHAPLVSREDES